MSRWQLGKRQTTTGHASMRPFAAPKYAVATAALAMVIAGGVYVLPAAAGPLVAQTLTPPPLPWLTCKPVGGGTICEGTRSISYVEDSGFACGAGPSAFVILDSATRHVRVKWTYDEQGLLMQRLIHFRYLSARLTNSLTGAELPYTQTQLRIDDLAVRGDLTSATSTYAGEVIVGSPGGAPVIVGAGKIVLDPTGEITFVGGTSGLLDLYSGDASALCAALN